MKKPRQISAWMLVFALLPLGGCLEISVRTSIAPDGSSERTVSVKRPARSLPDHGYPIPTGRAWHTEWRETGDKDQPFEYVATRRFSTPAELASEYDAAPDTSALRIAVSIDRSFEWFYTYVAYREIYARRNPFNRVPAREYFTPAEIEAIARGGKSDSLEKKIEEWKMRNILEELVGRFSEAVGDADTTLNASRIAAVKEQIFQMAFADSGSGGGDEVDQALRVLGRATGVRDLSRYRPVVSRVFAEVDSMETSRKTADSWISSVAMPGLLISSNGEAVEGNEVRWTIEAGRLLVTPVTMEARSRVVNVWAFVVTGAVGLVLLIPALLGLRRRRIPR